MTPRTAIDQMGTFGAVMHAPRRQHPATLHTLETLLAITILATMCRAQNWVEIPHWGQAQAAGLAEFLDLTQGISSHETCGRVVAVLDPESLQQACVSWMTALADLRQDLVARGGKTIRRP